MSLLTLWATVGEAVWGYISHKRFMAAYSVDKRQARLAIYRRWTTSLVLLGLSVAGSFVLLPGLRLELLGLRPAYPVSRIDPALLGIIGGAGFGIVVGTVVLLVARRRSANALTYIPGGKQLEPMLPQCRDERSRYVLLSLAAAIVEELVWRGMIVFVITYIFPRSELLTVACVSGAIFGVVHLYQGALGVLVTGLIGFALCAVYVYSGSLLIPVLLHFAMDVRGILLSPKTGSAVPVTGRQH